MIFLKDYCVYEVKGQNALNFLQGQVSNDVLSLEENQVLPALLCNVSGRILLMLRIQKTTAAIFLIIRKDLKTVFEQNLLKVALLSRVKLIEREELKVCFDQEWLIVSDTTDANSNEKEWHLNQIKNGQFDIYPETSGLFLPHDLGLEHDWVNFNKGCYRGQEIIARMHYLGKSKYHVIYRESDELSLKPGDSILPQGQVVDSLVDDNISHQLLCVKKSN